MLMPDHGAARAALPLPDAIPPGTRRTSSEMHRPATSPTEVPSDASAPKAGALRAVGGEPAVTPDRARQALDRARDHMLALQHEEGWWKGELATNVSMDAEDRLLGAADGGRLDDRPDPSAGAAVALHAGGTRGA